MREISSENVKIGEHIIIDGVEYVAEEPNGKVVCGKCALHKFHHCILIPCDCENLIFKRVEKEPQYRPYKDTDEMIADFQERFKANLTPSFAMPFIWVTHKSGAMKSFKTIITGFGKGCVLIYDVARSLQTLFDEFTYLDGSPCGKVEE